MSDKLCREAFEGWYLVFWGFTPCPALSCPAHEGMTYGNLSTENLWKGWQAAWSTRPVIDGEMVRLGNNLATGMEQAIKLLQGDVPLEMIRVQSSALEAWRNYIQAVLGKEVDVLINLKGEQL